MSQKSPLNLHEIVKSSIRKTLSESGVDLTPAAKPLAKKESPKVAPLTKLKEAIILTPRSFLIKTEFLSAGAKRAHELLYNSYVEAVNKIGAALDAASTEDAKSTTSSFRSLKVDETFNLNAVKLHELHFSNISDQASEIGVDSIPYMRLSRDFGTFEKWQFNFMACALSARSGWAVTYFEPYRNVFVNTFIDGHDVNVPVGVIPVLVLDMWEHAYFKDYGDDKKSYIISMMREINWNVVEARMTVVEKCPMDMLYRIVPVTNDVPEHMLSAAQEAAGRPPIVDVVPAAGTPATSQSRPGMVAPTAPPSPATQTPSTNPRT